MLLLFMGAAEEASQARKEGEAYWQRKLDLHTRMRERVIDYGTVSLNERRRRS